MPETVEDTAPAENTQPGDATAWLHEIDAALKRQEPWVKRADRVVKRYRDEREKANSSTSKINILWSNTEVLKGALYARTAKADVRRRFPDTKGKSPVYRAVAEILERGLDYCADAYDVDAPLADAVQDVLLPGRGTVWVVYDPEITEDGKVGAQPLTTEYVYWKDFAHGQARRWGGVAGVPWVARRLPQRKADVEAKWPDAATKINFDYKLDGDKHEKTGAVDQFAEIWEIWDRESRSRIYVARNYPEILQEDEDPLKLQGFFPCPMPLYSVTTTNGLVPVPEFTQYQDQASQLDKLSTRIDKLLGALKWAGIYDAASDNSGVLANLATAEDGQFLPHENYQQIRDKGGIESAFGFIPIDRIGPVVTQLQVEKQQLIQEIYEVTGISDIIRGATDPRETKGAQQLKAQFGSMRMQSRQREVQRFIRDTYRIKAEIIAEHWSRETIAAVTGIELPLRAEVQRAQQVMAFYAQTQQQAQMAQQMGPQQPGMAPEMAPQIPPPPPQIAELAEAKIVWEDVEAVLRSDERRAYAVDIETDSTVMQDAEAEKASRIEFMQATREMMADAVGAIQQQPMLANLVKEMTLFGLRSFKPGRHLEEAFEETFDQLAQQPPQPPPGEQQEGPDPVAMAKVEQDGQIAMAKLKAEAENNNAERQAEQARRQLEAQQAQAELPIRQLDAETANLKARTAQIQAAAATREAGASETEANTKKQAQVSNDRMATALTQLSQALAAIGQAQNESGEALAAMANAVAAPRELQIIKGADGRVAGGRSVVSRPN